MRFFLLAVALLFSGCLPAPKAHGPLPHEVYVWQRRWTPAVEEGLERAAESVDGFTVLIGEIGQQNGRWSTVAASVDFARLSRLDRPVGFGLRIGPYAGKFTSDDAPFRAACDLLRRSLDEARWVRLRVAEVQLDFDCPSARLADYATWVEAFRQEFPSLPLAITALPDWLGQEAFAKLAQTAGRYVLQVHAVPTSRGAPAAICDDRAARRAIAQAGKIGIPFRVALPTYGCEILADAQGKILGVRAEDSAPAPSAERHVVLRSDAKALAALVSELTASRPAALSGILWYRLPIDGERLNWSWPTLAAIIQGRLPAPSGVLLLQPGADGVMDIVLENQGDADWTPTAEFPLPVETLTGDGVNGFRVEHEPDGSWRLLNLSPQRILPPGGRLVCGWLRSPRPAAQATPLPLSLP